MNPFIFPQSARLSNSLDLPRKPNFPNRTTQRTLENIPQTFLESRYLPISPDAIKSTVYFNNKYLPLPDFRILFQYVCMGVECYPNFAFQDLKE